MDQSAPPPRFPAPLDEIAAAAIFLTRLPIRWPGGMPADLHPRSLAWYPLIGAALGLAAGAVLVLCAQAGLPEPLPALLAVAALVVLTGALHEDGLADVADGFGGGRDRAARLAIMRDSRVGTYGVLALGFGQAIRVAALAAMPGPGMAVAALVAAGALSRAVVPAIYAYLPPARTDGLAATLPPPPGGRVVAALALGAALAGLPLAAAALPAIAAALLAALGLALLAERQVGGRTGDVLGAGQQVSEIAVLLVLAGLSA